MGLLGFRLPQTLSKRAGKGAHPSSDPPDCCGREAAVLSCVVAEEAGSEVR